MNKKIKKISLLLTAMSSCFFAVLATKHLSQFSFGESVLNNEYSFELPPFSESESVDCVATSSGNNIKFEYTGYSQYANNWGILSAFGELYNRTAISGLDSISISCSSEDQIKLDISYGWNYSEYIASNVFESSSVYFNFNGEMPTYFKIENKSESPLLISNIHINYSCQRSEIPDSYCSNELIFSPSLTDDPGYCVSGFKGVVVDVVIPSAYQGQPVIYISDDAFANCSTLKSVLIPDSIIYIYYGAFENCSSLESIYIPSSVEYISDFAFSGCPSLTNVFYEGTEEQWNSIAIEDYRLKYLDCFNSNKIFNVEVDKIERIYTERFAYTLINKSIVHNFKMLDTSITSFDFEEEFHGLTIASLSKEAFYGCSSLTTIFVPISITSIGANAFYQCYSLLYVFYEGTKYQWNCIIDNGGNSCLNNSEIEYNCDFSHLSCVTTEKYTYVLSNDDTIYNFKMLDTSITSFDFEEEFHGLTIASLSKEAFYGCSSLMSLVIPYGVTSIEYMAFYGCSSLVAIVLPDTIKSIGDFALPAAITHIFYNGTEEQWNLIDIGIGNSNVFKNVDIEFNDNSSHFTNVITERYSYVLVNNCTIYGFKMLDNTITSFDFDEELPSFTVVSLARSAFLGCNLLETIDIPNTVVAIGPNAFRGCSSIKALTLPSNLSLISESLFRGCSSLESIVIPSGAVSIGSNAFVDCTSISSIVIPDTVTVIYDEAFRNCHSLLSIDIPNSVATIEEEAFKNCTSLTSIFIPSSVATMDKLIFSGCSGIIYIEANSKPEGWVDNWSDNFDGEIVWGSKN